MECFYKEQIFFMKRKLEEDAQKQNQNKQIEQLCRTLCL